MPYTLKRGNLAITKFAALSRLPFFGLSFSEVIMSLKYQIKGLMMHNKDGAFETQKSRGQILLLSATQLKEGGFRRLEHPRQLKQKHIQYLVSRWQGEGLSCSTIKNRVSHLRWLAQKIEKPTIVKSNEDLGIENRQYVTQKNKACLLDGRENRITDERIRDALRLQQFFGLRREESLKFMPELALKDPNCIELKPSWCKGGRGRIIPILEQAQRDFVKELQQKYPTGSLIHKHLSYKQMRDKYDNAVKAVGMGKCHGLRHAYAQNRYRMMTGHNPSVCGGLTRKDMSQSQKELDTCVRLEISNELGHGRIDVVAQYLGS
ncbi:phage integrase N-terminal domain-containing protein [uncultured Vibrio sp.]|uniref:phage integrase N-terminal domain-containing protein n=1 Tax=uncultured Vibrio sp. TaxID=114054 RepID=UPI00261AC4F2|nr:phage integrase N-terminal domain-containing protein [uncultured Vibrio sp.]